MLIIFQVLECLRGTSPTSSTTDSPRRDTPTDDIESESVFFMFVCLFSSLRMLILNQEKLYMSAYSVSSGNRAKNGETISKPRRVPLLLALNLSLSFCSRRFFSQLTVSPCLICLFVFSYRKHTVKALGSFAFMAGD